MWGNLLSLLKDWRGTLWMVLLLFSFLGMVDVASTTILNMSPVGRWLVVICISAFKALVFILLFAIAKRWKPAYVFMWFVVVIYCIVCVINGVAYYFYDLGITNKLFAIVGQTNRAELTEFFAKLGANIVAVVCDLKTYAALAIVALLLVAIKKMPREWLGALVVSMSIVGFVSLLLVMTTQSSGRAVFLPFARLGKSIVQAHEESEQIKEAMAKVAELPFAESVASTRDVDVIMVIGESASRDNLSIYGYELNSSPKLSALSDSLIVFEDVIGTSTITAYNMNRILTFLSDREDAEKWFKSPMLFAVMKKAGYKTWWLSNQDRSGIWGNNTVAMVSMADRIEYVGGTSSDDATLQKYDGILLPQIKKALSEKAAGRFIGVHLMGSHNEYRRRYPEEFSVFNADSVLKLARYKGLSRGKAATVAEYSNSLVYTDYVLGEIIGMVAKQKRPMVMIYFSDHGENVYDTNDDFCGRDREHVRVPFVVYGNRALREEFRETADALKRASGKPMTTASVSQMICRLTGTRYAGCVDTFDVLSPNYAGWERYVDGQRWN